MINGKPDNLEPKHFAPDPARSYFRRENQNIIAENTGLKQTIKEQAQMIHNMAMWITSDCSQCSKAFPNRTCKKSIFSPAECIKMIIAEYLQEVKNKEAKGGE